MNTKKILHSLAGCGLLLAAMSLALVSPAPAQVPSAHKTENVIVVMLDGLRWQEVFRGEDPELLKTLDRKLWATPRDAPPRRKNAMSARPRPSAVRP